MARACPSCHRPNADSATKCLYCSEPLPAAEPGTLTTPADVASERHLIILIPGAAPSEATVTEFSRITESSLYDARLSLSARRPRLFRRLETESEARRLSEHLAAARIAHYAASEADVLSLPISRARRGEIRDRHVELELEATTISLPFAELLLLVRGEITRERHHEKRLGTSRSASTRLSPSLRLHLHAREASVAVEIDPERFDWSLLGDEETSSALLNFQEMLDRLSANAPAAEVDRGFDQETVVLSRSEPGSDVSDVLVEGSRVGDGVTYDNEAQFRYYSRWRYRLARHFDRSPGRAGKSYTAL